MINAIRIFYDLGPVTQLPSGGNFVVNNGGMGLMFAASDPGTIEQPQNELSCGVLALSLSDSTFYYYTPSLGWIALTGSAGGVGTLQQVTATGNTTTIDVNFGDPASGGPYINVDYIHIILYSNSNTICTIESGEITIEDDSANQTGTLVASGLQLTGNDGTYNQSFNISLGNIIWEATGLVFSLVFPPVLTSDVEIDFPAVSGTLALLSDVTAVNLQGVLVAGNESDQQLLLADNLTSPTVVATHNPQSTTYQDQATGNNLVIGMAGVDPYIFVQPNNSTAHSMQLEWHPLTKNRIVKFSDADGDAIVSGGGFVQSALTQVGNNGTYVLKGNEYYILVNGTAGSAQFITLSTTLPIGFTFVVKSTTSGVSTTTISGTGCTIDGLATFSSSNPHLTVIIMHAGSGVYWIVSLT